MATSNLIRVDASTAEQWMTVQQRSFFAHPEPFSLAFFPQRITPAIREWQLRNLLKALTDPANVYFVIPAKGASDTTPRTTTTTPAAESSDPVSADDQVSASPVPQDVIVNGTAIGGAARWLLCPDPKTQSDMHASLTSDIDTLTSTQVPGLQTASFIALRRAQYALKVKHVLDEPYLYLWILGTDPAHLGKRVGTRGLEWGFEEARRRGWRIWVESSEEAVGFYQRAGFVAVGELEWDGRHWGLEGRHAFMGMVWTPEEMRER